MQASKLQPQPHSLLSGGSTPAATATPADASASTEKGVQADVLTMNIPSHATVLQLKSFDAVHRRARRVNN